VARSRFRETFDDRDYPAYSMGAAAEILGVTPAFLRALDDAQLINPRRSGGGHRRYSRHELERAARARKLVDDGMTLAAACRVVTLEDQVSGLEGQVSGLEGQVSGLEGQVSGLEGQVSGLEDRLERANQRLVERGGVAEGEGPVR
jgi:DNA-binding transcriptional MerR regulator